MGASKIFLISYISVLALIYPLNSNNLIGILYFIFLILFFSLSKEYKRIKLALKEPYFLFTLSFFILCYLNAFMFPLVEGAQITDGLKDYAPFPLLFAMVMFTLKIKNSDFTLIFRLFSILILINALLVVFIYFPENESYTIENLSRHAFANNTIGRMFSKRYAVFSAIGVIFGLTQVLNKKNIYHQLFFILISVSNFCVTLMTGCRGVIITLIFLLFLMGTILFVKYLHSAKPSKMYFVRLTIILAFIIIAFVYSPLFDLVYHKLKAGIHELSQFYQTNKFKGSWGTRLFIWDTIIKHTNDFFWVGLGVSNINTIYTEWFHEANINSYWLYKSHNIYLQHISSMGIFGLSLFLITLFYPIYKMFKEKSFCIIHITFILLFVLIDIEDTYLSSASTVHLYGIFNYMFYYHREQLKIWEQRIISLLIS